MMSKKERYVLRSDDVESVNLYFDMLLSIKFAVQHERERQAFLTFLDHNQHVHFLLDLPAFLIV